MAAENISNADNLCITEDAFDEFQATSMLKEDDYITLSDIAPPETATHDLAADMNEIPYDNEVVLTSNLGEEYEVNSNSQSGIDEIELPSASRLDGNVIVEPIEGTQENDQSLQPLEDQSFVVKPRRGRKKTNFPASNTTTLYSAGNSENSTQANDVVGNENKSHMSKPRGRPGRKPKNSPNSTNQNTQLHEKARISELSILKGPRKRGRPRKQGPLEETATNTTQPPNGESKLSSDITNHEYDEVDMSLNDSSKNLPGRRGRKKRILPEEAVATDSFSQGILQNAETTDLNHPPEDLSFDSSLKEAGKRRPGKRGRPRVNNIPARSSKPKRLPPEKIVSNEMQQKIVSENILPNEINSHYDDGDDISLSRLKKTLDTTINANEEIDIVDNTDAEFLFDVISKEDNKPDEILFKSDSEVPEFPDTEHDHIKSLVDQAIDTINEDDQINDDKHVPDEHLLVEDTSKRPVRRKVKQTLHYDEGSDEDPFANIELSDDDEPRSKRKGRRYNSDDEYVPDGGKRGKMSSDDLSDSDIDNLEGVTTQKRKRTRNSGSLSKSPRKKIKNAENSQELPPVSLHVTTVTPHFDCDDDVEVCLQTSVIKANDDSNANQGWGTTREFESFIAQKIHGTDLKIKKANKQNVPLEIPIMDANKAKKFVEMCSQTNKVRTTTIGVQTSTQYDIPMKHNVSLTLQQSEKACEFLNSVVKTTSELGQLMTQKSEDFITKKINTSHVTDTLKMDYCVKKSFLLFKLAKHNLVQMEEDLSKQYDDFLKSNGLQSCIEEPKIIAPKPKAEDSDSDCEIVEEPIQKKQVKPKFNPKTVFLNKELSIKIAKKPSVTTEEDKKGKKELNIKGRHTVWISDSVMVKKVKPTQSFLAQDSRNKKPPDCFITEEMVSDFFKHYNHQKAQLICAPFTSTDWLDIDRKYICCYFYVKSDKFSGTSTSYLNNAELCLNDTENNAESDVNNDFNDANSTTNIANISCPHTLFTLCTSALQKYMHQLNPNAKRNCNVISDAIADLKDKKKPESLFRLCLNILVDSKKIETKDSLLTHNLITKEKTMPSEVLLLKTLCFKTIRDLIDVSGPIKTQGISCPTTLITEIINSTALRSNAHELLIDDFSSDYIETVKSLCSDMNKEPISSTDPNESKESSPTTVMTEISNNESLCDEFTRDAIEMATLKKNSDNGIKSLLSLCVELIQSLQKTVERNKEMFSEHNHTKTSLNTPECLKKISLENIKLCLYKSSCHEKMNKITMMKPRKTIYEVKSLTNICFNRLAELTTNDVTETKKVKAKYAYKVRRLADICFETVTKLTATDADCAECIDRLAELTTNDVAETKKVKAKYAYKVRRLADICFETVTKLTATDAGCAECIEKTIVEEFTINSVNTMSEEAFHNIRDPCLESDQNSEDLDNEESNFYNDDALDNDFNNFEEDYQTDNNWVSQVQMKELKSCFIPAKTSICEKQICVGEENTASPDEQPIMTRIKLEPLEEISETVVDSSIVKAEPISNISNLDGMTVIPDSMVTKRENLEDLSVNPTLRRDSSSYDVDTFEAFVMSNKMMHSLTEFSNTSEETFNQSAIKVRRQYDPDSDTENNFENDPLMNLLIPQAFEPLIMETAKDHLMESSSDDGSSKKSTGKKKPEKRGRGRPKKSDRKQSKDVPAAKDKALPPQPPVNEVTILTRKMREKIRQEEKKNESSDSESDNVPLNSKKDKDRKESSEKSKSGASKNTAIDEIQCNNVDSTEQIDNSLDKNSDQNFTGFTAVDQNEISNYEKYVKFVYNKILPKHTEEIDKKELQASDFNKADESSANINEDNDRSSSPLMNFDEPVEMLECEPTMPIFDDNDIKQTKRVTNRIKTKSKIDKKEKKDLENDKPVDTNKEIKNLEKDKPTYTERHGWHCYPITGKDKKLHQNAGIFLEKLPESFVETYFRYQNITDIRKEDEEVDRLINLQSLNRSSNVREGKSRTKIKGRAASEEQTSGQTDASRPGSAANSEHYDELTPSEDEHNVDDELPPPAPRETNENNLAKNSLMDENESDLDENKSPKIKNELNDDMDEPLSSRKKKSKLKKFEGKPESLMLTADKMMNRELNLLHAPVVMKDEVPDSDIKGLSTRKHKNGSRSHSTRDRLKAEDDSSSEEEKQWVTTKEKLLKRMGKKDTTSADDAKRAKLVSEFIERRGDAADGRKRGRGGGRRRSRKKMLEREKQLRVLSKELFGETSGRGGKFSQSYFKGRRNIRKVIDKKSLTKSTVTANMEEFERKRRLSQRHDTLREALGCEEGVNVLVINDEVCLEYDFQTHQPVVTIHQFFTKVMKAHQYEGVKFLWDACFESLEKIESGHPGGGCILAHCMGLGKTLQVLALLHTVLTHPRVGMRRVLVCCPLSTVLNWVDEIHKWIGPVTDQLKVFELSKLKKTYERAYQLEDWYSGGGIFIIGYELFRSMSTLDPDLDDIRPTIVNKIRTALLDPGPDIIVCDEGHLLKNDCSVLAVAMSRVATKRRIVLTGTPMQNNLREYYCMVNFIKPNLLGTYSEYSNRFENPIMNGQHRDSQTEDIRLMKQRTHILHKVLEGCLQRQEASVLYPYLPEKHEYTVFISPTKCQWDLYKHYMDHYAKQSKQSMLRDFHTLQKIWSHPQVLHNFMKRSRDDNKTKIKPEKLEDDLATEDLAATEDMKPSMTEEWWLQHLEGGNMLDCLSSSNKFVTVFRILDECIALDDKVLIFSTSLITMDSLEFFLKKINKWSLGHDYYRLDGSVPPEVRQKWCREFNAENNVNTKLFLISTRAGSLGLNMVAANRVIILDTSWNPAHDIQSIFRVYRFGQKKDCYIYRLVAMGTMEQKIYERSVTKQAVACRVVDEQQIDRHYNMAELTELYKFDESGVSVAGGVAVGVTDVALLRVARHAAVHAVHEHDSLLRGSSEQSLPEHERDAAWMQFEQEHAHKQMQNQLAANILQIPLKRLDLQRAGPSTFTPPGVKLESTGETKYWGQPPPPELKPKRGRPRIPMLGERPPPPRNENEPLDESVVKKIMDILIKHNFQNRQGPKDIADLVSNVRKIVAYGTIPTGSFNKELTESIANVLLGNESAMPALTDVCTEQQKRKGKSRKQMFPSTSNEADVNTDGRTRRKAAIDAERQFDAIADDRQQVIDLDDDDWHGGSDTDSATEVIQENTQKPDRKGGKEKTVPKNIESQTSDSILLSDDDEPVQVKPTVTAKKSTENKIADGQVVPLPASLLSNNNFIKIVAHTYLKGNPMMDEDAAILAARYSTQKALKEIEDTGKKICSGPIYDIAVTVLGKEILEKVHKSNVPAKTTKQPVERVVKPEPSEPRTKPIHRVKAKGLSELMTLPKLAKPLEMGVVKTKFVVAPHEPSSSSTPTVVPVGLFKTSLNLAADVPEESILPDDDDIHLVSDPTLSQNPPSSDHSPPTPGFRRLVGQPTILNKVLPKGSPEMPLLSQPPNVVPKFIQISNGKVIMTPTAPSATTAATSALNVQQTASTETNVASQETICLDSDDEEATLKPPAVKPKRGVAMKSTAKKQVTAAIKNVVPTSLAAANPELNLNQPMPSNQQSFINPQQQIQASLINMSQLQNLPTNKNYVVIPASHITKLTKLPQGVVPPTQNVSQGNFNPQNVNLINSLPQNINLINSIPQNIITSVQQNLNLLNSMGQNMALVNTMPQMTTMPHMTMPQMTTMPHMTTMPQMTTMPLNMMNMMPQMTALPQMNMVPETVQHNLVNTESILPTNPAPTAAPKTKKTVCKPGDILRITDTGRVEILNRANDDVAVDTPRATKSSTVTSSSDKSRSSRQAKQQEETKKPQRVRKVSSSSSSSSSSRASSPEDPLSILKDVVHIRAPDVSDSSKYSGTSKKFDSQYKIKSMDKKLIGNTSITMSSANSTASKTATPPINSITITSSKDQAKQPINKRTLTSMPVRSDMKMKAYTNTSGKSFVDAVDLTDADVPPPNKVLKKLNKNVVVGKTDPKAKSSRSLLNEPSKIVGTSKNIIISGTGKATKLTMNDHSAKKTIKVTNVENIASACTSHKPWNELKRPAASAETSGPKRKRNEPMTLKDFDIDDFDDIIELE